MLDKLIARLMAHKNAWAYWRVRIIFAWIMGGTGWAIASEPATRGTALLIEQHALFGVVNTVVLGSLMVICALPLALLPQPRPQLAWALTLPLYLYFGYTVMGWIIGEILLQGAIIAIGICALIPLFIFMWSVRYEQLHHD